jgi:benzoylformate decarboxylase
MYSVQALFAAGQLNLPITFVVLNNRRYQALKDFGRVFGVDSVVGTDLSGLDFVSIAKGHGIPNAWRVGTAEELDAALAVAMAMSGPNLVEICVP